MSRWWLLCGALFLPTTTVAALSGELDVIVSQCLLCLLQLIFVILLELICGAKPRPHADRLFSLYEPWLAGFSSVIPIRIPFTRFAKAMDVSF